MIATAQPSLLQNQICADVSTALAEWRRAVCSTTATATVACWERATAAPARRFAAVAIPAARKCTTGATTRLNCKSSTPVGAIPNPTLETMATGHLGSDCLTRWFNFSSTLQLECRPRDTYSLSHRRRRSKRLPRSNLGVPQHSRRSRRPFTKASRSRLQQCLESRWYKLNHFVLLPTAWSRLQAQHSLPWQLACLTLLVLVLVLVVVMGVVAGRVGATIRPAHASCNDFQEAVVALKQDCLLQCNPHTVCKLLWRVPCSFPHPQLAERPPSGLPASLERRPPPSSLVYKLSFPSCPLVLQDAAKPLSPSSRSPCCSHGRAA